MRERVEMERLGDVVGAAAIWSDLTTDAGDKEGLAHPASQEKFKGGAGRGRGGGGCGGGNEGKTRLANVVESR